MQGTAPTLQYRLTKARQRSQEVGRRGNSGGAGAPSGRGVRRAPTGMPIETGEDLPSWHRTCREAGHSVIVCSPAVERVAERLCLHVLARKDAVTAYLLLLTDA